MQSADDIPTFETESERNMIWSRGRAGQTPVLAIRDADRGFLFMYDMAPTGTCLADATVQELRNIAKPQRLTVGPTSQIEVVGGTIGAYSGTICCPSETTARHLAAHLRPKITDTKNWT